MIPSWILDIFAAVMLVVAAVSAGRLVAARPGGKGRQRAALADVDVAHLLMAIAMAGTLSAGLRTLPDGAWEVIFGVLTAWFGYRVTRDAQVSGVRALAGGHCAAHLIHAAAMLYMFAALAGPAGHGAGMTSLGGAPSMMGTLSLPSLAFVFALLLIGYGVWDLDQLSGPGVSGHYSLAAARVAPAGVLLARVAAGTDLLAVERKPAAAARGVVLAEPSEPGGAGREAVRAGGGGHPVLAPWVATGARITMGVTMAFMLLIMI
jgi:Domain of unknown function (DUF5134)